MASQITEEMAVEIYQQLLDQICTAYFENDFDAFQAAIHVPHRYSTKENELQITTCAQMREAFDAFRGYLKGLGVTDFIRICTGAAVLGPTKIIAGHTTEFLRHGNRLHEPYEVWATLEFIDGTWKVTSSENAITDTSWQAMAFRQGATMTDTPRPPRAEQ